VDFGALMRRVSFNEQSMKSTINPQDARVQFLMDLILQRADAGYPLAAVLQRAVLPVFLEPGGRRVPVQVGSCVVVAIDRDTFVLSAAHVFDDSDISQIQVGCGNQLIYLGGERYSSGSVSPESRREDPVDAAVLRVRGQVPDELRSRALSLIDLDTTQPPRGRWIQFALGYRASQSGATGRVLSSQLDLIPSFEFDDCTYKALQINRAEYTASAYDDEVPIDGKWQASPKPKGISGGAILDIYGLSSDLSLPPAEELEAKMCSIVTAWRSPIDGAPSALVGSRVSHHLKLIKECWPEIDTGSAFRQ
jgi:hypothetical protein